MGLNSKCVRTFGYLDTLINKFTNIEICNVFIYTISIIEKANYNRIKKVILGPVNCVPWHFKQTDTRRQFYYDNLIKSY